MKRSSTGRYYISGRRVTDEQKHEIVVRHLQNEEPATIITTMNLDIRTIRKYISQFENQEPHPRRGRPELQTLKSNIYLNALIDILTIENPMIMLKEIRQAIWEECGVEVSYSWIYHIRTQHLHYSRKRISLIARKRKTEHVQNLREYWRHTVFNLDIANFVFIDESHFDFRVMNRTYGYFKKGVAAEYPTGNVTRLSFSLLLAQSTNNIVHQYLKDTTEEGVRTDDFLMFFKELIKIHSQDTIYVLDNAKIHHANEVHEYIEANDILVVYLSPYSPDYTPIELTFGYIKRYIREYEATNFQPIENEFQMHEIIQHGINFITPDIIRNNTIHTIKNWNKDTL